MDSNRLSPRVMDTKANTSGLTTDTNAGFAEVERRTGGLTAALLVRTLVGTAPSITGKIQHSPSPLSVNDAAALWFDLLTFTAITTTATGQIQQTAVPYFPRLRSVITRGGTAVTQLDYDVVIV